MLKEAVGGGGGKVLCSHEPRAWKQIISYNANALYLLTMLRDMPCGKEKVVHYDNLSAAVPVFRECLKTGA